MWWSSTTRRHGKSVIAALFLECMQLVTPCTVVQKIACDESQEPPTVGSLKAECQPSKNSTEIASLKLQDELKEVYIKYSYVEEKKSFWTGRRHLVCTALHDIMVVMTVIPK